MTKRTDFFFKVTVEHDAADTPEKLGQEIARHLLKFYGVADVELSSVTPQD